MTRINYGKINLRIHYSYQVIISFSLAKDISISQVGLELCEKDKKVLTNLSKMTFTTPKAEVFRNIMKPLQTGCAFKVQIGRNS